MARILILEPDPDVCALLARYVTALGHDSAEGDASVDLVVVEPGDRELAQAAADLAAARADLPVICVSIYPERAARPRFPAAAFMTKPVSLSDFGAALSAALS